MSIHPSFSLAGPALLLALAIASLSPARAQTGPTPTTIAYQGVLEDGGAPVADGAQSITIRLFRSATGGSPFYTEIHTVTITHGVFSLPIGGGTPASGAFDIDEFSDAVWVEVMVASKMMSPRTALQAVPYALGLAPGAVMEGTVDPDSPFSAALRATNTSTSTLSDTYGIIGRASSTSGHGVYGQALAPTGTTYGVYGQALSTSGRGVYGWARATSGTNTGVYGESRSTGGRGVYGWASATSGSAYGVNGVSESTSGRGIYGWARATSGTTTGVYGLSQSTSGRGVFGRALASSGTPYAIRGEVISPDGYAGYFEGGRGLYTETADIDLPESALVNDDITIEANDAIVGLYSDNGGSWGSGVALGEINDNGELTSKWAMVRETDAAGSSLYFTFKSGPGSENYSTNFPKVRFDIDGKVFGGTYSSSGADFAEWLPLASSTEVPRAGDVVGVTAGRVGLATNDAEQVMIISSNPAFVGNPDAAEGGALVALVGQAEVRLASSTAQIGDLLVASGTSDGTARAVSPARYNPATDGPVAGRIIELLDNNTAVALVGVDEAAALRGVVVRQQTELATQRQEIDALRTARDQQQRQLDALSARLDALAQMPSE